MNRIERIKLLLHTVRYLKPVQVYGRLWKRIRKPKPDLRAAAKSRPRSGASIKPCARPKSLVSERTFRFLNAEYEVRNQEDWNDDSRPHLWTYNLHYFDFLRSGIAPDVATDWIDRWIDENPVGTPSGWDPYTSALRIVNWVHWELAGNCLSRKAQQSMAVQMRFLLANLETHIQANHLLVDFKGLYFAAIYFQGHEADRLRNLSGRGLIREIEKQFLADGGHFELSPMYHGITLEDLLDLAALQSAYPNVLDDSVDKKLSELLLNRVPAMLRWMKEMTHPDGDYVLMNDAAQGIAPLPAEIAAYAERCGFVAEPEGAEIVHQQHSGHIRVICADTIAFLDVGDVGASYQPGHAHADTLSFEWSLFGQRFVVDTGTAEYSLGPLRTMQRSTAAHNTVQVDESDSSEVWDSFRVGRRAKPLNISVSHRDLAIQVKASHDGYARIKGGPIHTRSWTFTDKSLQVIDGLSGNYVSAKSRFHLHPEADVRLIAENDAEIVFAGNTIRFVCAGGNLAIENTTYSPQFGLSIPNKTLVVTLSSETLQQDFSW